MAESPLLEQMTPEQRAKFINDARALRKLIAQSARRDVASTIAKGIEGYKGVPLSELRRRYNRGPDPRLIASYSKQLSELAQKASKIDYDRAAKVGELSKKKVDLMVPMLNILNRTVTAEGQFATGVAKERISQIGGAYRELIKTLQNDFDNVYSPEDSDAYKNITKEMRAIRTLGQQEDVKDLNLAVNNQKWLDAAFQALQATAKPGDKDRLYKGLASQFGDREGISFTSLLEQAATKNGTAKSILNLRRDYQKAIKDSEEKMVRRAQPVVDKMASVLGARRPQYAKGIKETYDALANLDGTKGAQQALDTAIAGLIPKEGELSPIQKEQERLLEALADEKDTRSPVQAARQQFWNTEGFQTFATPIAAKEGKTFADLTDSDKIAITREAFYAARKANRSSKSGIKEAARSFRFEKETGKDPEARVLPQEPNTEPSGKPSAEIVQPPAVTDTTPEVEDVADYSSVPARWNGEPVEMRLKEENGVFSLEIVKDGVVDQVLNDASDDFSSAMETFSKSAEYIAETGEQPSELFGITSDEAVSKMTEQLGQMAAEAEEQRFQQDLPDDPFGDFEDKFEADKFAEEARQVEGLAPTPTAPLTVGAPIVSATIEDITPTEKVPEFEAEMERSVQGSMLRKQMDKIMSDELQQAGVSDEQASQLEGPARLAEILRRKMQVDAGTGRQ